MNKKVLFTATALVLTQAMTAAYAGHRYERDDDYRYDRDRREYYDTAKVLRSEPVYRRVEVTTPRRECWTEEREHVREVDHHRSHTPVILGGIIGGALGHQVGNGRGRDAATVAGAILGASVGRDYEHRNRRRESEVVVTDERVCRVRHETHVEQRLQGYNVTYRYRGKVHQTFTEHDPGDRIPVHVNIRPVEYDD